VTSIVVLVQDGWEMTAACFASLFAGTDEPFELIVVDNGSTDGTEHRLVDLAARDDRVTVVRNDRNRGFPAGVNQGLALARGERVVLLNNDTLLPEGWLRRLSRALADDPGAGLVGPITNYGSMWQAVPELGELYGPRTLDAFARRWERAHALERRTVPGLVGFCVLIDRTVIDAVGGLDEQFGIGTYEDMDYCVRARLAGFRCVVAVDAFVHHEGSVSLGSAGAEAVRRTVERNASLYRAKWRLSEGTTDFFSDIRMDEFRETSPRLPLTRLEDDHVRVAERTWVQAQRERPDRRATTPEGPEADVVAPAAPRLGGLAARADRLQRVVRLYPLGGARRRIRKVRVPVLDLDGVPPADPERSQADERR
jgi:GT2 family glycosyltransferase